MHTFSGAPARTEPGCHGTRTPGTLQTQPAASRAREERLGPKEKQPHGEWLGLVVSIPDGYRTYTAGGLRMGCEMTPKKKGNFSTAKPALKY